MCTNLTLYALRVLRVALIPMWLSFHTYLLISNRNWWTSSTATISNCQTVARIHELGYILILKMLLQAERTADWKLHLFSITCMINLFAATGHNNYARCACLYVEMMNELPTKHPELYRLFMSGGHVARRSSRVWSVCPLTSPLSRLWWKP